MNIYFCFWCFILKVSWKYIFFQVVEMSALHFLQTTLYVKSVHFIRISVIVLHITSYISVLYTAFAVRSPKKAFSPFFAHALSSAAFRKQLESSRLKKNQKKKPACLLEPIGPILTGSGCNTPGPVLWWELDRNTFMLQAKTLPRTNVANNSGQEDEKIHLPSK